MNLVKQMLVWMILSPRSEVLGFLLLGEVVMDVRRESAVWAEVAIRGFLLALHTK